MKLSVITCACNQGDWVRKTVPKMLASCNGIEHEIIIVDDHSTDGCCHDLTQDVTIIRTLSRMGVSRARRVGVERSSGDVLMFTDPHCEYEPGAFAELAGTAKHVDAIIQPISRNKPGNRGRMGGQLTTCDRGLRIKYRYGTPHPFPALLGTVYAVQRKVYDALGGWPQLPGCWSYSEQALTLMAWSMGVPIIVNTNVEIVHYDYQNDRKFPFSVSNLDMAANAHWVHAAFFPESYPIFWKPIIDCRFQHDREQWVNFLKMTLREPRSHPTKTQSFKGFASWVSQQRVRSESSFFAEVFDGASMPGSMPSGEAEEIFQAKRSQPKHYRPAAYMAKMCLEWLEANVPGCFRRRRIVDIGSRDGYAVKWMKDKGAEPIGYEIVRDTAQWVAGRRVPVVHGDMLALPEPTASADIVTSIHSLEHAVDAKRALMEMLRVLRPKGWLLLVVPWEPKTSGRHHISWQSIESFVTWVGINSGGQLVMETAKTYEKIRTHKLRTREYRLAVQRK